MCGIVAVIYKTNEPSLQNMEHMAGEQSHRGREPFIYSRYGDGCRTVCDVVFNRLAITDIPSPQPGKAHGWDVYLNGEIYNYKELGYCGTECEVIAQGINKHGSEFINRLNGMFVIFAINGNRVIVARDRWGQKPLYYWKTPDFIVFSSEIKPVLKHKDYRFSVDEKARSQLLTFCNILTHDTLFDGVKKFPKGTYQTFTGGEAGHRVKFWSWDFTPQPMEYGEAKQEVRRLVEQSVKRQTPQEVAYGSCLSGGVDSAIIAALAGDVPTFTVGYNGQRDERPLAELSRKLNFQVVFDRVRDLEKTIYHLENPLLGASWMHYALYQMASKFVTVLFDGAGADELFFGYPWRYDNRDDYWHVVNRTGIYYEYCSKVFGEVFPQDTPQARYRFDADHFLESVLLVVDRLSMAHTIEVRCPFLDNDLVDFAQRIPYEYKQEKRILKEAFSDVLPAAVRTGSKKGFTTPPGWIEGRGNQAQSWIQKALQVWQETFLFNACKK